MNAVEGVRQELLHGEQRLADELIGVSDRHRDEHEIHHVARDLERWSREHARRLVDTAGPGGADRDGPSRPDTHLLSGLRDRAGALVGRRPEPGLVVLRDLRILYLMASDNSLHWEMLAQAAQARRDTELLQLVNACHPQTLRQVRWANTLIKTMSPQILTIPTSA